MRKAAPQTAQRSGVKGRRLPYKSLADNQPGAQFGHNGKAGDIDRLCYLSGDGHCHIREYSYMTYLYDNILSIQNWPKQY